MQKYLRLFQEWFNRQTEEEKKRFFLICTAVFSCLLTVSVIISIINADREELPLEGERLRFNLAIPAEELFLPEEPDFLPGVLLERERRESWSEQDADEYWQDPLRSGEEQWRVKIEAAIDEFLERVQ